MQNLRPQFLTILCILTFIGSSYGIYQAVSNYTAANVAVGVAQDAFENIGDQIDEQANNEEEAEMANKIIDSVTKGMTEDNVKQNAIAALISNILTLLGAILMWGLNKKGYILYVIGVVVMIFAPMFIFGGFMGAAAGAVYAFVGILFSVLYGLNMKHLA